MTAIVILLIIWAFCLTSYACLYIGYKVGIEKGRSDHLKVKQTTQEKVEDERWMEKIKR